MKMRGAMQSYEVAMTTGLIYRMVGHLMHGDGTRGQMEWIVIEEHTGKRHMFNKAHIVAMSTSNHKHA